MAEKRIYIDSNGENGNSTLVKRPKTGVDADPPGTSVDYQHLSGDEDRPLDSGNYKDPLSGLTKDQRVVLYTLFMSFEENHFISLDVDVSMGDIDVMKTVKELAKRGLVKQHRSHNTMFNISDDKRDQIMRSYRKNCLLSDIDKDFYIQLASNFSLKTYAGVYLRDNSRFNSRESEDTGPITLMRLIVEGRAQELYYSTIEDKLPPSEKNDIEEFRMFVKDWCKVRDIDPMALSDGISDERMKNFYSAFTILSGLKDGLTEMHFSQKKWNILISLLMSENYSICLNMPWKEKGRKMQESFMTLQDAKEKTAEEDFVLLKELIDLDKLLREDRVNNTVHFVSEDVRHQVLGYFVLNCLKNKGDYENYINLSSVDSLFEYARPLEYKRKFNERCLYLPHGMEKLFISRLGMDSIRHAMVGEFNARREISSKFNIPEEILNWDYDARNRYVECAKKGTLTIHRARVMIVGCAGAGKTTLLKRLQHRSIQELKQIKSTIGLEVLENIFELDNTSLKVLLDGDDTENKYLLSVVDFAGQCAYYACHQVYLSRRAFYLLVIDLSKPFGEKVHRTLCEQEGTMFSDWTYGQYVIFWLKSIHTYCDDDTPVIVIATHCDMIQTKVGKSVYDDLLELLKDEPELKKHLNRSHCFEIGLPLDGSEPAILSDIEECIASIASEDRWKETIPKDWALCEVTFRANKRGGKKIISLLDFRKQVTIKKVGKERETYDVLRFYHDIGTILYFNEEGLKDNAVIDVQGFVDCFKYIITDPLHVRDLAEDDRDWRYFYESGYLSDNLLKCIWKKNKMDIRKCKPALKYMQRLGLVAVGDNVHYVPCVNKLGVRDDLKKYLSTAKEKTSVLVFQFQFLPHFFYFRLVVACMVDAKWTVATDANVDNAEQKYLFKNAVCFTFQEHLIVLVVSMKTIQVQIFRQGSNSLSCKVAKEIRNTITENLKRLTKNFHKRTLYSIGYQCSEQNVFEENICFLKEDNILKKGKIACPKHEVINHHYVEEKVLLQYWTDDTQDQFKEEKDVLEIQEQKRDDIKTSSAKFRKKKDNVLRSTELENFYSKSWHHSVGHLRCYNLTGTAFRVGDRYLMTAFHIIHGTLDAFRQIITEKVQSEPNRGIHCSALLNELGVVVKDTDLEKRIEIGIKDWIRKWEDSLPLSFLLDALAANGFSNARDQALQKLREMNPVFVVSEEKESVDYPLKFDIPYYNETEDIAIMEINWTNLPMLPFALERTDIAPESVHIVGYPASHGTQQIFDPKCPLISEMEAQSTLQQWRNMYPWENIENFSRACDSAFSGKEKVLFHCSESTAHGASGSPGLILLDADKPKVYLMLQEGFPSFVYGDNFQEVIKSVPKESLIESGISMSRVYSLLSQKPHLVNLRNAIFHI